MAQAQNKKSGGGLILIIFLAFGIAISLMFSSGSKTPSTEITVNEFAKKVEAGNVTSVDITGNKINVELADGSKAFLYKEVGSSVYDVLEQAGVEKEAVSALTVSVKNTENDRFWTEILISIVPFLLIILFFVFMMRSAQAGNNQAMSFGKSSAKVYDKKKQKTTFNEVAGADEAKEELMEVVDFLKDPKKYEKIGAKIPKGVLLIGRPGTGKTLLARAVAGEADVPFFNISGSEFVEMFVGVGASRVRDLFTKAKRNAPCIIFIDEIDAVGRHRGAGMGGGHDEREQTLNQILTEMDGFETGTNIIVIAATNRPDILDPALLRPGRFDRRVVVDNPTVKAREDILKVHSRNKPIDDNVDFHKIAKGTPGFTGADLENLMNEAAILAAKENQKKITREHVEKSIEKVVMGPARKSKIMNDQEKKITAYHEVGHALVGHLLPGCDPVHKVSIVSRGMALGVTWFLPDEDKVMQGKSKFEDELCSLLGGYTAEETFFGEMSTGASNDLEKATSIARNMVTRYGMSELGPISLLSGSQEVFLGKDFGHTKAYSEAFAEKVDSLVSEILQKAHEKTREIIKKHKGLLTEIAEELLKKETLSAEEFKAFFKDGKSK